MKTAFLITCFVLLTSVLSAQKTNPDYDPSLAKKLGADERGMKMYVLVLLKTGPNNVQDTALRAKMFRGHFENINRLADQGKLIVAGPLDKNDLSYRGIFIMDVPTIDEARALLDGDPTIREKIFVPELIGWYGSAALPEYIKADKMIRKTLP